MRRPGLTPQAVPATVNGMLGGYESLSDADAAGSLEFLKEFVTGPSARIKPRRVAGVCSTGRAQCIQRVSRLKAAPARVTDPLTLAQPAVGLGGGGATGCG